jgi:hypothetical protein
MFVFPFMQVEDETLSQVDALHIRKSGMGLEPPKEL